MAHADILDLDQPAPRRARLVLARRLTDIVGLPESRLTPRERWIVGDLLHDILRASDVELRKRCAERLADISDAPQRLLRLLGSDVFEIAAPILERSKALSDFDVMEIARLGTLEHRLTLARRDNLSAVVTASLVAHSEPPVVVRILRNETADIASPTMDHIISASKDEADYARHIIRRAELRPSQAFRLFWWSEHGDRCAIIERFAVQRTILIEAVEDVFSMAADENWADPLVSKVLTYIDRRQRDRGAAEVSPYGSLEGAAAEMAMDGPQPGLVTEIAKLASINRTLLVKMFDDMGGEAIAVLCKATGLKWDSFEAFWRGLGRPVPSPISEEARKVYDSLSVEKAQTVLRYWNLSIDTD